MKNKILCAIIALLAAFCLFSFTACGNADTIDDDAKKAETDAVSDTVTVPDGNDMFSNGDKKTSYSADAEYTLNGGTITSDGDAVTLTDGVLSLTAAGTYVFSGNATNFTIEVNAPDEKVTVVLKNLVVENDDYAVIYVKSADKVFVFLEGENSLTVSESFVKRDENKVDGAVFAKDDITFQGSGLLKIKSSKNGVVAKDDLKIVNGTLEVTASAHALEANDSVRLLDCSLTLVAGKDGIHVENEDDTAKGYFYIESGKMLVTADGDGVDASGTLDVQGGTIDITSGGGSDKTLTENDSSTKGLKSDGDMLVAGGTITINSLDDGIHSNSSIAITGGKITVSSGDDGVHADTSLIVSGGDIAITKSYEGLEGQNVNISGGTIKIKASDDGINAAGGNDSSSVGGRPGQNQFNTDANCFIKISGGNVYVNADGDGIDSNGNLIVSGGTTIVEGPTSNGDGALDYDGTASVTGGTLVALGSGGMAMNFSTATQGSVLINFSTQNSGSNFTVKDESGNEIFALTTTKSFSSITFTSPDLKKNGTYAITAGNYSTTITLTAYVYGGQGGGFPGGGQGGQGGFPGGGKR